MGRNDAQREADRIRQREYRKRRPVTAELRARWAEKRKARYWLKLAAPIADPERPRRAHRPHRCSECDRVGHNVIACPALGRVRARELPRGVRQPHHCSRCLQPGHNRRTCAA